MDRKEFLQLLGLGTAGAITMYCTGCSKESTTPAAPTQVDFTLNLDDTSNSALKQNGGYIYSQGIIVARTVNGDYVAVSQACTHQGTTVTYQSSSNTFHCSNHGSRFNTTGGVSNGPAASPLTKYNTSLNGTMLRVFS